ncbi:MAG: phosphatidate cytidylyltransferase [Elusimicrobiota bacterium]|jgi:phosphatidate cytidylyltransferase|nr:phosphatidate cytidylyltransferase [Elusimicrobiota bacterium]
MLKTRILTALVGIPLIFICIFTGGWIFFALMFIVNFFCIKEYLAICKKYEPNTIFCLIAGSLFFILLYFMKDNLSVMNFTALLIFALLLLFGFEVFRQKPDNGVQRIAVSFLAILFFPISFLFMVFINQLFLGGKYMFLLFVTVWVLDTAAYAIGKRYGKRKLSPHISPNKTIEGAIAGLVSGILFSILISNFFGLFPAWKAAILGLVIAIAGQFSDLAESLIKRDADIKDSGAIIPGHGGVLDRFDSYLFAAPIVYYLILCLQESNY